jgi:hypothetical protein
MTQKAKKDENEQVLHIWDVEELAASLCGIDSDDAESDAIQEAFYEKYDIDYGQFEILMTALFGRLDFAISSLAEDAYVGFSTKDKGVWLIKKNVNREFVNGVIRWLCENKGPKEFGKGFSRIVTLNGKPEYEITITRPKTDEPPKSA